MPSKPEVMVMMVVVLMVVEAVRMHMILLSFDVDDVKTEGNTHMRSVNVKRSFDAARTCR